LVVLLAIQSWPVLSRPGHFELFTSTNWDPNGTTTADHNPVYGSLVFVYGTVVTSAIAMLIAVPLGVGTAAFLSEIAPGWIRRTCSFLTELLASIPSVVFGFWGLFFVAPAVDWFFRAIGVESPASGQGILAAGLILAVMILPYITAISFDVCRAVPSAQRQGALALGATRWQMIRGVVLPYARPGILAACFLALGRALGETMAITMLIGNVRYLNLSLSARGDSIASIIAGTLHEANDETRAALISLGLILFVITAMSNAAGRYLIGFAGRSWGRRRALGTGVELPEIPTELDAARQRSARRWNRAMTIVLALCQLMAIIPLFLILGYILFRGAPAIDADLFTKRPAAPPFRDGHAGGLGHAMLGSLIMVSLATVFAVPVGILAAVFLSENRTRWSSRPIRFATEVLGGVPSIVIGVFAYSVIVYPPWASTSNGFSAWAGIFALGVMMLPVVVRATEESLNLVPTSLRHASYALGATQSQTVIRVIGPAALPAIVTGVLLAVGRIAGETAPLLLTARDSKYWPGPLDGSMASLPYYIYDFSTSSYQDLQNLAWGGALVLLAVVIVLNVAVRLVAGRRVVAAAHAE
jgi:phosphate transport system permease protein